MTSITNCETLRRPVAILVALLLMSAAWSAPATAQNRVVLQSKNMSDELRDICKTACAKTSEKLSYEKLSPTAKYFVRIAPRKYILNEKDEITPGAILGTKPLVFVTTAESLNGRSLLEIYQDIGYEAEDIIRWQRNEDMVGVVFRYPPEITLSTVRDGQLPENWKQFVFVPTWDNAVALFERLAKEATVEPDKKGEYAPEKLFFRSQPEQWFVLGFPAEGKKRLKTIPYNDLKAFGGSDWAYRSLIETKLSIFEHFMGNGRTHNEVTDPKVQRLEEGLFEFVGPNRKVTDLPEVAVIHLGKLTIEDSYSLPQPPK